MKKILIVIIVVAFPVIFFMESIKAEPNATARALLETPASTMDFGCYRLGEMLSEGLETKFHIFSKENAALAEPLRFPIATVEYDSITNRIIVSVTDTITPFILGKGVLDLSDEKIRLEVIKRAKFNMYKMKEIISKNSILVAFGHQGFELTNDFAEKIYALIEFQSNLLQDNKVTTICKSSFTNTDFLCVETN